MGICKIGYGGTQPAHVDLFAREVKTNREMWTNTAHSTCDARAETRGNFDYWSGKKNGKLRLIIKSGDLCGSEEWALSEINKKTLKRFHEQLNSNCLFSWNTETHFWMYPKKGKALKKSCSKAYIYLRCT